MRVYRGVIHGAMRVAAIGIGVLVLNAPMVSASAAQGMAPPKSASKVAITLTTQPTPVRAGENQLTVTVKGADGKPITDADVSVAFVMPAMPEMKMPEMRNETKLKPAGDGKYTGSANVPMAGTWDTTVSVKKDGKDIGQKKVKLTAK